MNFKFIAMLFERETTRRCVHFDHIVSIGQDERGWFLELTNGRSPRLHESEGDGVYLALRKMTAESCLVR
jgi:hypothetical protein